MQVDEVSKGVAEICEYKNKENFPIWQLTIFSTAECGFVVLIVYDQVCIVSEMLRKN